MEERNAPSTSASHKEKGTLAHGQAVTALAENEPQNVVGPGSGQQASNTGPTTFGGGLKRPLEMDETGRPMIKRRKVARTIPQSWIIPAQAKEAEMESDEWEGFSASPAGSASGPYDFSDCEDANEDDSDVSGSYDSDDSTSGTSMDESADEMLLQLAGDPAKKAAKKERSNAFKSWATQQRNDALGFQRSNALENLTATDSGLKSSEPSKNGVDVTNHARERHDASALPKVPELASSTQNVYHVAVNRSSKIDEARLALPVVAEEQKIMEAICSNNTVIICGSTGSGKTTQVPQFLFEAGYGCKDGPTPGMIGVTQPRRVAAVSMAKRVAEELGDQGGKVAHQIRFDSTASHSTAVKFMTDGVLLREVGQDFTLSKYSVIILDEAHERSVNTDILIGMLSRVVETRAELSKKSSKYSPLKLVIMSATLRTADLLDNRALFRAQKPPMIEAEGRQFPVTTHFARRTDRDYLEQAFSRISRGHRKLPPGAMLVFLTGQNEIQQLAKRLRSSFASTDGGDRGIGQVRVSATEASLEDEDIDLGKGYIQDDANDSDSDAEIRGLDNDGDQEFEIGEDPHEMLKVHILPLYSQLPTQQQMRVFQPPPEGSRMIVLATNVAETSLTIPGVRYVFDCGRAKQKQYNQTTGIQSFDVDWISKASASQRAGRAGRTGPGHCYRLYSSAVYERDFAEFAEPEMTRSPIEGVVLQLKSMGIPNVTNFPFPTPPDSTSLVKAERLLEYLGAIADGKVTALGKQLSLYPLSPRLAKMLCLAQEHDCVESTILLVASLTVGDVFIPQAQLNIGEQAPVREGEEWTEADNQEAQRREDERKEYNSFHGHFSRFDRTSDAVKLQTAMLDFISPSAPMEGFRKFTRTRALNEALQLRKQLSVIVATNNPSSRPRTGLYFDPNRSQIKSLRKIIASGYIDQIAQRADLSPTSSTASDGRARNSKRATDVAYLTLFPSGNPSPTSSKTPNTIDPDDPENSARAKYIYIHPSSVLSHQSPARLPQFLIYSHLSTPAVSSIGTTRLPRTRMHPLTPVSAAQIIELTQGTPLLVEGKPIGKIEAVERDEKGREGRCVWTVPFLVGGKEGGLGWPLPPARKVVQRREGMRGWLNESVLSGEK